MKKIRSMRILRLFAVGIIPLLMAGCSSPDTPGAEKENSVINPDYEIAPPEYAALAAKSLTHLHELDMDAWTSTMSDDVVYYFPDGDAGTRTELTGKQAVLDWWTNWKQTSGIRSMSFKDHLEIPVIAKNALPYSDLTGVFVFCYFSSEIVFITGSTKLRMNFSIHFNEAKQIDRVYTYYDRTMIIQAMGKNILGN